MGIRGKTNRMFKQFIAKLGKGAATVNLRYENRAYYAGETLKGEVKRASPFFTATNCRGCGTAAIVHASFFFPYSKR
jgi:hypothetical protein